MFQMLQNLPHITKNILIINVLLFVATFLFQGQINLSRELAAYPLNSVMFEPYQIITHFFMHGGFMHLLLNMFGLVMFGAQLERIWGAKRFFIFYIVSALGAFLIHIGVDSYNLYLTKNEIIQNFNNADFLLLELDDVIKNNMLSTYSSSNPDMVALMNSNSIYDYIDLSRSNVVGASGALFGLLVAFGVLFPNTPLVFIFLPIPIKAKYLIIGVMVISVILSIYQIEGDRIAHLAHVGGGITGFIILKIWQRNRTTFY